MAECKIDGALFSHQMSAKELKSARKMLNSARQVEKELRQGIRAAKHFPNLLPARIAHYLASGEVIVTAAIDAVNRKRVKAPRLEECLALPKLLNTTQPLKERSLVRAKKKNSGGFRAYHEFRLQHRTAQTMVKNVLDSLYVPRTFQYGLKGTQPAIADLQTKLIAAPYFATFDVVDYFGSFDPSELATLLPVPKGWVDHVVLGRHMAVIVDKPKGRFSHVSIEQLLHHARQGIPAGSRVSSIVAEFVMRLLQVTALGGAIWNYCDNFLILAQSEVELKARTDAFVAAVGSLPGGNFKLKAIQKGCATVCPLDFLGHRLRLKSGCVEATMSQANQENCWRVLGAFDSKLAKAYMHGNSKESVLLCKRMISRIKGWQAAFKCCRDVDLWIHFFMDVVESNSKKYSVPLPYCSEIEAEPFELDFSEYSFFS